MKEWSTWTCTLPKTASLSPTPPPSKYASCPNQAKTQSGPCQSRTPHPSPAGSYSYRQKPNRYHTTCSTCKQSHPQNFKYLKLRKQNLMKNIISTTITPSTSVAPTHMTNSQPSTTNPNTICSPSPMTSSARKKRQDPTWTTSWVENSTWWRKKEKADYSIALSLEANNLLQETLSTTLTVCGENTSRKSASCPTPTTMVPLSWTTRRRAVERGILIGWAAGKMESLPIPSLMSIGNLTSTSTWSKTLLPSLMPMLSPHLLTTG